MALRRGDGGQHALAAGARALQRPLEELLVHPPVQLHPPRPLQHRLHPETQQQISMSICIPGVGLKGSGGGAHCSVLTKKRVV